MNGDLGRPGFAGTDRRTFWIPLHTTRVCQRFLDRRKFFWSKDNKVLDKGEMTGRMVVFDGGVSA